MNGKKIVILVLAILVVILIFQNTTPITIKLFFWPITMSRALLYPVLFGLGAATGWIGCTAYKRKSRTKKPKAETNQ